MTAEEINGEESVLIEQENLPTNLFEYNFNKATREQPDLIQKS